MTKPPQKQRIFTRSNFAEHNYNYLNRSQTSKPPRTNPHNHSFSQRQNSQQQTPNFVNFNDDPQNSTDPSENYPFFQQNKNSKQQYQNKQKKIYYTPNYLSSDDDDFHEQNHQQNFQNQRLHSYHVNQLDMFELYTREQHMRQPRPNHASQNNNFYSQNPANTDYYGIYTIEISTPRTLHDKYVIQTDDIDLEFSKVFTEYIKSIQYQNSQRANSIFTNEVFSLIYSHVSMLEIVGTESTSPVQTSRHTNVRNEIAALSAFLNTIRENFSNNEFSPNVKYDSQKILAWFIIDYFAHNINLITQARKNFGPQSTNDDTLIAEQSDYIWDPEWSHPLFLNIPTYISSQAISTISIHRDYVKVFPLTIDATPLNCNSFLPDRRQNNSLNSTLVQQENLNGTRNLTQQDIQTPSHFINKEIVETIVTTTQQSISPIHPNLTTPKPKTSILPQVTLQSTVKPSVAPKYSPMDYQTFRPMTKPPQKQRILTRSNFAEHIYNYVNRSQTSKPPRTNPHNRSFSQRQNSQQQTPKFVNLNDDPRNPTDPRENYPFFQQNKNSKQPYQNKQKLPYYTPNYLSSDDDDFHDQNHQQNFQNQRLHSSHVNQPDSFEPYTREQHMRQPKLNHASQNNNFYSQNPANTDFHQPTQMQNEIPLPYYLQQHEITKNQLTNFSQMSNAAESLQMTMNPYHMGGSSITSNKPLKVFTGTDPEYFVEDYLNAVTANLILNIEPEPINTLLHQNWIHRSTALIQTILDGAAQKWFSVLPIDIKTDWKIFTQEYLKIFDSERNKQHQRVYAMKFADFQMKQLNNWQLESKH